ncbi:MAG: tRNA pseudouridine(55) synthase TruB [Gammaproteobacteria bacterium]|nr:tRNA pseudouridine(55) synthase TruB [Gammaproteobacteria bacterium]MBP74211.1 tRNA pseudouridine(55) synthase TruB [Gammaproteobacteria bacterium]
MSRKRKGRAVNGILVVDKPAGISSNDVVQQAKRLFGAQKVGHTGSLDPLATGVLPLCFGEATKFSQYLLDADKKYWAQVRLGITTETGDADGEVIAQADASSVTPAQAVAALETFVGEIEQIPSMYSALKHQGQPLYKLARKGIEVERAPRQVSIYSAELLQFSEASIELRVHCSKGTYIRSLAEDLGAALGCGAHVSALRRLAAGPYEEGQATTLAELCETNDMQEMDALLLPVSSAVDSWPAVRLHEDTAHYVRQGQPVQVAHAPTDGWVQIFELAEEDRFLGVGEILTDGRVAPRRLVAND